MKGGGGSNEAKKPPTSPTMRQGAGSAGKRHGTGASSIPGWIVCPPPPELYRGHIGTPGLGLPEPPWRGLVVVMVAGGGHEGEAVPAFATTLSFGAARPVLPHEVSIK